jgi:hypothetical protein
VQALTSSAPARSLANGLQIEQFGDFVACDGAGFGAQAHDRREAADASLEFMISLMK